jgi:hypothetical protein
MDKTQIFIYSAVIALVAVRLYQKFVKKDKGKLGSDAKHGSDNSMLYSSKDDDYEPYSKK